MSRFQVIVEELVAASAAVTSNSRALDGSQTAVAHSASALAGTPVAGAYMALVNSLETTTARLTQASTALASALVEVSNAYQQADNAAAKGVTGGESSGGGAFGGGGGGW